MTDRIVRWVVVPLVLIVVLAGVVVGRVVEAIAVASVLFVAWRLVRSWVSST